MSIKWIKNPLDGINLYFVKTCKHLPCRSLQPIFLSSNILAIIFTANAIVLYQREVITPLYKVNAKY